MGKKDEIGKVRNLLTNLRGSSRASRNGGFVESLISAYLGGNPGECCSLPLFFVAGSVWKLRITWVSRFADICGVLPFPLPKNNMDEGWAEDWRGKLLRQCGMQ